MLLTLLLMTSMLRAQDNRITIAVLPFTNITGNIADDWLSRGFAEEVTGALSTVPSLLVIERNQLEKVIQEQDFQLSDLADQSRAATVGTLLSADKLLIGSFQITGTSILVTARVIDAKTGALDENRVFRHEDDLDNIFSLYSALASSVVEGFSIKLTSSQSRRLDKLKSAGTKNIKAYENYARAMEAYRRGDEVSLKEARSLFKKALSADKKFTAARQALANTHIQLNDLDDAIKEYERIRKSGVDVTEDILNTLGLFYVVKGKTDKALESFQAAIQLNGTYAEAFKNIGLVKYREEKFDDALLNFRSADRLDPENPEYLYLVAVGLMRLGKQYDALSALREALENGFHDRARVDKDAAWSPVRTSGSFQNLLDEYFD